MLEKFFIFWGLFNEIFPFDHRWFEFYFCRQKIGPNIDFKGNALTTKLAPEHNCSFIYVSEDDRIDNFLFAFKKYGRDFDVLDESPGNYQIWFIDCKCSGLKNGYCHSRYRKISILFEQWSLRSWAIHTEDRHNDEHDHGKRVTSVFHVILRIFTESHFEFIFGRSRWRRTGIDIWTTQKTNDTCVLALGNSCNHFHRREYDFQVEPLAQSPLGLRTHL